MTTNGLMTNAFTPVITGIGVIHMHKCDVLKVDIIIENDMSRLTDILSKVFAGRMDDLWVHWRLTTKGYGFSIIQKYFDIYHNVLWEYPRHRCLGKIYNQSMYDYAIENNLYTEDFLTGTVEKDIVDAKLIEKSLRTKLNIIKHANEKLC